MVYLRLKTPFFAPPFFAPFAPPRGTPPLPLPAPPRDMLRVATRARFVADDGPGLGVPSLTVAAGNPADDVDASDPSTMFCSFPATTASRSTTARSKGCGDFSMCGTIFLSRPQCDCKWVGDVARRDCSLGPETTARELNKWHWIMDTKMHTCERTQQEDEREEKESLAGSARSTVSWLCKQWRSLCQGST